MPMTASPERPVCSQKMTRQEVYVTMMPPMKGPKAGPINVPERNHPIAVARSVGRYISLSCARSAGNRLRIRQREGRFIDLLTLDTQSPRG